MVWNVRDANKPEELCVCVRDSQGSSWPKYSPWSQSKHTNSALVSSVWHVGAESQPGSRRKVFLSDTLPHFASAGSCMHPTCPDMLRCKPFSFHSRVRALPPEQPSPHADKNNTGTIYRCFWFIAPCWPTSPRTTWPAITTTSEGAAVLSHPTRCHIVYVNITTQQW